MPVFFIGYCKGDSQVQWLIIITAKNWKMDYQKHISFITITRVNKQFPLEAITVAFDLQVHKN